MRDSTHQTLIDTKSNTTIFPGPIFYTNWVGLCFSKLNPWLGRINQLISNFIEVTGDVHCDVNDDIFLVFSKAGLIEKWERATWARMREETRAAAAASGEEPIDINTR